MSAYTAINATTRGKVLIFADTIAEAREKAAAKGHDPATVAKEIDRGRKNSYAEETYRGRMGR